MDVAGQSVEDARTLSPFELENLLHTLSAASGHLTIDAGKGQPDWIATTPRDAWLTLGEFALAEAKDDPHTHGLGSPPNPDGLADRLDAWCAERADHHGARLLAATTHLACAQLGMDRTEWAFGITTAMLGNKYPYPARILNVIDPLAHAYFINAMCGAVEPPSGRYQLFATEGGAAAMGYVFTTLRENQLLCPGDRIAIGAPIFTPYLEIPGLSDVGLHVTFLEADAGEGWQFPDVELEKLRDPSIKALFLVNPGNPQTRALDDRTLSFIRDLVAGDRPDLMIITDDVYGTFVDGFRSLAAVAPSNTICVYSYSKHFGATGERVALVALHEDNIFDATLRAMTGPARIDLQERYGSITSEVDSFHLMDRMAAESRSVALFHIAGLSTPQQVLMALMSAYFLLDDSKKYVAATKRLLRDRLAALLDTLGIAFHDDARDTHYYRLVNLVDLARRRHPAAVGSGGVPWDGVHVAMKLAAEHGVVVLPGGGFDAPNADIRVSLANQPIEQVRTIGRALNAVVDDLVTASSEQ